MRSAPVYSVVEYLANLLWYLYQGPSWCVAPVGGWSGVCCLSKGFCRVQKYGVFHTITMCKAFTVLSTSLLTS